jgi:hypothetical protein
MIWDTEDVAQAMPALINQVYGDAKVLHLLRDDAGAMELIAEKSYLMADAMIKAR